MRRFARIRIDGSSSATQNRRSFFPWGKEKTPLPEGPLAGHAAEWEGNRVFTWGWGCHGALGRGHYNDQEEPHMLAVLRHVNAVQVSAGWGSSAAVSSDGVLFKWGWMDDVKSAAAAVSRRKKGSAWFPHVQNLNLSYASMSNATTFPVPVPELVCERISRVDCNGGAFTAAVSEDGRLFTWGVGAYGQLGHNTPKHQDTPRLVESLQEAGVKVVDVAAGFQHMIALDDQGRVWATGKGSNGRLGLDHLYLESGVFQFTNVSDALQRHFADSAPFPEGLDEQGRVVSPSSLSNSHSRSRTPPEHSFADVTQIVSGFKHSACLTSEGRVWTWGFGRAGALGLDMAFADAMLPTCVEALAHEKVVQLACGQHHMVALTDDGRVYTWGANRFGQTGHSWHDAVSLPGNRLVPSLGGGSGDSSSTGASHLFFAQDPFITLPSQVDVGEHTIVKVFAGFNTTSLLTDSGALISFGTWEEDGSVYKSKALSDEQWGDEGQPTVRYLQLCDEQQLAFTDVAHGWEHHVALLACGDSSSRRS